MLDLSFGLNFFLKVPRNKKQQIRSVYMRVTVNGIPKETSTKMRWDYRRWDQQSARAIGSKEDARTVNTYLDELVVRINQFRTSTLREGKTITSSCIIDFVNGKTVSKMKVLEEFQQHNDELFALIGQGVKKGTYERYVTARSHVYDFIKSKYNRDDLEFRELNFEFITAYEFYLRTIRKCANNTTLKYISNFKKIVLRAVAKEIIPADPFRLFTRKKTKIKKYPLTKAELSILENKQFSTDRLNTVRDIFIFQCYTGLAYIDVFQLKKTNIKMGFDGRLWIISRREKTESNTDIPLLPKALEIMEKYKDHPVCIQRGSVLPVRSNQKMNEYLKEIAELCGITSTLNTHKARRTFASTVTLNNGVSIHVVKELLGHHSVKQTEEYALTEHEAISKEMTNLTERLSETKNEEKFNVEMLLKRFEKDLEILKSTELNSTKEMLLSDLGQRLNTLKLMLAV
ncbi:site-specific integrase [Pedobacter sp. KLB.chiD]|uniref:site-specific integrase n=1 Tax=Pedobacter sp. KLB.chiD TaxID=3387402 RepID=UPI00399B7E7B